jgi:uncharacterized protein
MMMALGQFAFSLNTLAFQELQRQTTWRHPSSSRVGSRAARQFTGPGEDTINLSGELMPELIGSPASLRELREMAKAGLSWPLVDGAGHVYGSYVIESLNETKSVFMDNGLARKTCFQIQLACTDAAELIDEVGAANHATANRVGMA